MGEEEPPKVRPFLKWAGGKYEIAQKIRKYLPEGKTLIEPFVGAGAIFLNTDYPKYTLNDVNQDLINLYKSIQENGDTFIKDARKLFSEKNNTATAYYRLRDKFNNTDDHYQRSLIFLYLNKFGYNGLCRYNKSGGFNVPFGRHKNPGFPEKQLIVFSENSKKAKFVCEDFGKTFNRARKSHVIYCDPPYAPASETAYFSDYATGGFDLDDQERLANIARKTAGKGITVVISNHDTKLTRKLYKGAKIIKLDVRRNISCNSTNRRNANELIAIFRGEQ
ncbi:Dam family site-specific DNA-(adenine-N6)-methyltransferase [Thiohalophilus sp.]|uniref:Dam family site-specific DNA-(adenine-N6)-methyltransferase n=1 Tax=Thiohalophilus sp. TaxID=3028392 RepID=UPI002ACE9E3A|nr:Dam family site-specific DNA-(adenine-N6)-methyltransferase [Thiohalophilus sp.]MDZ7660918.1 Dam family site-specific DNA-(adenine-N6)-methyltransferase [Thiohalophilus sp.]